MPIKIPDNLPARKSLLKESVNVIDSSIAERQDIRPLRFLLLNLMPKKINTEIQFARLIGASPLQIELTLMTTKTYNPKNITKDYLIQFYKTLDDIKDNFSEMNSYCIMNLLKFSKIFFYFLFHTYSIISILISSLSFINPYLRVVIPS